MMREKRDRTPMNITLNPEQERFIQEKMKSGRYQDASEIIHEAFQRWEQWEQYEQTRQQIQAGLAELERGEGIESETVIAQMREKIRQAREAQ